VQITKGQDTAISRRKLLHKVLHQKLLGIDVPVGPFWAAVAACRTQVVDHRAVTQGEEPGLEREARVVGRAKPMEFQPTLLEDVVS
jgi:hypothetical protein